MTYLLAILMVLTAIFLILLVLVQRGRGGGLAGALGGMGGQSAFGTKAGDLFTRITIGVAAFWILLCVVSVKVMSSSAGKIAVTGSSATESGVPNVDAETPLDDSATGKGAATESPDAAPTATEENTGPALGGSAESPDNTTDASPPAKSESKK